MGKVSNEGAYLIVRCIGCKQERAIAPGEIPEGEHPCCSACGMPMLPTKAKVQKRK